MITITHWEINLKFQSKYINILAFKSQVYITIYELFQKVVKVILEYT